MLREVLAKCHERLPEKPRQALAVRLASEGGRSDDELASLVGMRLNTFLQNFTRARRMLAECLKKHGVDRRRGARRMTQPPGSGSEGERWRRGRGARRGAPHRAGRRRVSAARARGAPLSPRVARSQRRGARPCLRDRARHAQRRGSARPTTECRRRRARCWRESRAAELAVSRAACCLLRAGVLRELLARAVGLADARIERDAVRDRRCTCS